MGATVPTKRKDTVVDTVAPIVESEQTFLLHLRRALLREVGRIDKRLEALGAEQHGS